MKHIYNSTAAFTQRPTAKAMGTAAVSKFFTLMLLGLFLLVSGESVGQGGANFYDNNFNIIQKQGEVSVSLTKGLGPTYPNGELTIRTGTGQNSSYSGWIRIFTDKEVKVGYRYSVTLKAKVNGSGANKNGTFMVKFGESGEVSSTNGVTVIPTVALNSNNTIFQNFVSTKESFATSQQLVIGIYIEGAQNNSEISFDDLVVTEICAPDAPQVTSAGTCAESGDLVLRAMGATDGNYYYWYKDAAGGDPLKDTAGNTITGPVLQTGVITSTTNYYVAIVNSVNPECISPRVLVTASVSKLSAPLVTSNAQCGSNGSRTITFTASGAGANESYRWYNSTGSPVGTGSTIDRSTNNNNETGVHYVIKFSTIDETCISDPTYLVVPANNSTPTTPNDITTTRCTGGSVTIEPVYELGMTYRWYSSGGTYLGEGLTYTISSVSSGVTTYKYRKLNTATGCISEEATIIINGTASIAATGNIIRPNNPIIGQSATFSFESNIQPAEVVSYQWYYHIVGSPADNWVPAANTRDWTISEMRGDIDAVRVVLTLNSQNTACYSNLNIDGRTYEINDLSITPLPVELMFFKAQAQTKGVNLTWATASELENKGFEVQVSSNGRDFKAIGFVESKVGTTSLTQHYSFLDTKAVSGTRYYRLKQIDFDGTTAFSPIRAVALSADNGTVSAYPNPFDDAVIVTLNGTEARNVQVVLIDAMGKVLQQRTEETSGNSITVDMRSVTTNGMYVLHVLDSNTRHTFKLMKR